MITRAWLAVIATMVVFLLCALMLPLLARQDDCDAAYPSVCIPPPPPDLDCSQIRERNFKVEAPDPHHFDRDGDGVGCEEPTRTSGLPFTGASTVPLLASGLLLVAVGALMVWRSRSHAER